MRKTEYDRLNAGIDYNTKLYYASATATHILTLAYASYFFRYRTLNKLQVLGVATAWYFAFPQINNIQYKLMVEKPLIDEARKMGAGKHVQPNGTYKNRGLNY